MSGKEKSTFLVCPDCGGDLNRCVDSRPSQAEASLRGVPLIHRRRPCNQCGRKHSTFELTSADLPTVLNERQRAALSHTDVQAMIGLLIAEGKL